MTWFQAGVAHSAARIFASSDPRGSSRDSREVAGCNEGHWASYHAWGELKLAILDLLWVLNELVSIMMFTNELNINE